MSRLRRAWARLAAATRNLASLIVGGWKRLPKEERKPIARALMTLAVVITIGGIGLLILSGKPKRAFRASLSCREFQTPSLLQTTVHYGARELRLWKYIGEVDGVSRSSIKPASSTGGAERLRLQFSQVRGSEAQLRITPEGSTGQELAVSSPAGAVITLPAETSSTPPSGNSESLAELQVETKVADESTVSWQIFGPAEVWHNGGLDVKGFDGVSGVQTSTLSMAPITGSLIQADFETKEVGAKVRIGLPQGQTPVSFTLQAPMAPASFSFAKCNSKEIIFDESLAVPVAEANRVSFDQVTIKQFELTLPEKEPRINASLSGETHEVNLDGYGKNPSRLAGILSAGWDKRTIVGLVVLAFIWLFGKIANRAVEVLAEVIIPDPPEASDQPTNQSVNEGTSQTEERAVPPALPEKTDESSTKTPAGEPTPRP